MVSVGHEVVESINGPVLLKLAVADVSLRLASSDVRLYLAFSHDFHLDSTDWFSLEVQLHNNYLKVGLLCSSKG
jgi:hypothetical protein